MMAKKILVGFDFDHTIIDENSDIYVQKLAPNGIPDEIKAIYSNKGWTEYMGAIFEHLHQNGVTPAQIRACMKEIPLVSGMEMLFQYLSQDHFDVVIISDSNSLFIKEIMESKGLDSVVPVDKTFTNPAKFDADGCLQIEYYHTQDWCKLSTVNLCKGQILESYIADCATAGKHFDVVAFVGDGSNDLCPCLRLKENDLALPRIGYRLEKQIPSAKDMKAKVIPWDSGIDILSALESAEME